MKKAKKILIEAGVPCIPGFELEGLIPKEIKKKAIDIGFPVMIKAAAGGGGRGMRPIARDNELEEKVLEGRREAEAAFGNGDGYLEKTITRARHVEVQILGDKKRNIYHIWERECSLQRRNQKVVERRRDGDDHVVTLQPLLLIFHPLGDIVHREAENGGVIIR